jgi:hypothetical protein
LTAKGFLATWFICLSYFKLRVPPNSSSCNSHSPIRHAPDLELSAKLGTTKATKTVGFPGTTGHQPALLRLVVHDGCLLMSHQDRWLLPNYISRAGCVCQVRIRPVAIEFAGPSDLFSAVLTRTFDERFRSGAPLPQSQTGSHRRGNPESKTCPNPVNRSARESFNSLHKLLDRSEIGI